MKLYYDTLVPYMPDATKNDAGEMVPNEVLAAGRSAMIELSEFQLTGNVMALYQSVIYACKYAGADLIDSILNIPDDLDVRSEVTIGKLIDDAAIMLFKSINTEKYLFDLNAFLVNILTAEHYVFIEIQKSKQTPAEPESTGDTNG